MSTETDSVLLVFFAVSDISSSNLYLYQRQEFLFIFQGHCSTSSTASTTLSTPITMAQDTDQQLPGNDARANDQPMAAAPTIQEIQISTQHYCK